MCGIVAIQGKYKQETLMDMLKKIKHRGPDDDGVLTKDNVALGHVRLSIIDVEGGHQPIFNEDKSKCIVFNGEIYNYKVLRDNLKNHHNFSTKTDTEIILHLYEEEGPKCVEKLDGMFTFAIYDNNKLFLARDRLGIKPLYYGTKNNTLYFASEMKALLYCDKILVFLPGYYYTSEEGFVKYYSLPQKKYIDVNLDVIIKEISLRLNEAVEKRLMADVPVGVFLSGGLDSSIVAAVMRQKISDLHSFSVGMEGSKDLEFANELAKILKLNHHTYVYNSDEVFSILPEVIYYLESFDAPLVRSAIPCYFVSKLAKENNIKVVLTGEGSDELFSGYSYLKKFKDEDVLFNELVRITYELHNTNLQRVDRLTMANSVEGRVPFLDIDFLTYVFSIPTNLKYSLDKQEKWLLREAFKYFLPESIIKRPKQKFSDGAGSIKIVKNIVEGKISDTEFETERNNNKDVFIRTKEELFYYNIFKKYYSHLSVVNCIGRTKVF